MINRLCKVLVVGLLLGLAQEMGAQTYEQFVEKSFDLLDQNDLLAAGESLKAALRLEPANPNNYALLMNLGTIQRRQGLCPRGRTIVCFRRYNWEKNGKD